MAHMRFSQTSAERALWLSRYAGFAAASEIGNRLSPLGPDDEEGALLVEAGFTGTRLFHAGLAFRGWVTHA